MRRRFARFCLEENNAEKYNYAIVLSGRIDCVASAFWLTASFIRAQKLLKIQSNEKEFPY